MVTYEIPRLNAPETHLDTPLYVKGGRGFSPYYGTTSFKTTLSLWNGVLNTQIPSGRYINIVWAIGELPAGHLIRRYLISSFFRPFFSTLPSRRSLTSWAITWSRAISLMRPVTSG